MANPTPVPSCSNFVNPERDFALYYRGKAANKQALMRSSLGYACPQFLFGRKDVQINNITFLQARERPESLSGVNERFSGSFRDVFCYPLMIFSSLSLRTALQARASLWVCPGRPSQLPK